MPLSHPRHEQEATTNDQYVTEIEDPFRCLGSADGDVNWRHSCRNLRRPLLGPPGMAEKKNEMTENDRKKRSEVAQKPLRGCH